MGYLIEFRINGEDPGRNFLPAPGVLRVWRPPSGPGVRPTVDSRPGTSSAETDSLLAKLIVTGRDRQEALERSRRALAEFDVEGIAPQSPSTALLSKILTSRPPIPTRRSRVHTRWDRD